MTISNLQATGADALPSTLAIAVLASERGSNLKALIDARDAGKLAINIVLVASDKADAAALTLARDAGIATLALDPRDFASRADFDRELFAHIAKAGPQLIVLAGFMRILDAAAIAPWQGRMINIHPSLLPKYPGLHTHRRALRAGDAEHGCSVHFVSAVLDGGPVIAQVRLLLQADDDEDRLAARLLPMEHQLLTAVVAAIAAAELQLVANSVHYRGQALHQPLQLDSNVGLHSASNSDTGQT
ncbi:MAG: phosphoribosylglycinamide formyltransferase [Xanthomonadales bacterium]|nr:phosphoribosylglycinamide formyltransferase [Xanthomonadales bacterium]